MSTRHPIKHMQCNDLHGIVEVYMTRVVAGGILPQEKCYLLGYITW